MFQIFCTNLTSTGFISDFSPSSNFSVLGKVFSCLDGLGFGWDLSKFIGEIGATFQVAGTDI